MAIKTTQDTTTTENAGAGSLTEAMRAEIGEMLNGSINGAMTSQLGRFRKTFMDEVAKAQADASAQLVEQIKASLAPAREEADAATAKKLPREFEEKLAASDHRLKEMEKAWNAEKTAREQERTTRLVSEERGQLANILTARGLSPAQVKAAVAMLHTEDKRVTRAEDGSIVFKMPKGTGPNAYVEDVALEVGADAWLKTDEGKAFAPPRDAAGSGAHGARGAGANGVKGSERADALQTLAAALTNGTM